MSISGLTKPRAQAAGIGGAGSLRIDIGFLTYREYLSLSRIVRSMVTFLPWILGAIIVAYAPREERATLKPLATRRRLSLFQSTRAP